MVIILIIAISNAEIKRQTLISQKLSFQTLLKHAEADLVDELNIHPETT